MKKIICLALALIMMFAMGIEAFAWTLPEISVNGTYDSDSKLKDITATVEWNLGGADCRLVLMTQYLESPTPDSGNPSSYGDFTNYGNLYGNYSNIEAVEANADFGVVSYTEEKYFAYGSTNELTFDLSGVTLDSETTYYIYFWTSTGGYIYPDFLVAAIKTEDGVVKYSPVEGGCRNTYGKNNFQVIIPKDEYSITTEVVGEGTVATDVTSAEKDEVVTITVTPDDGYELESIVVKDESGAEITVENNQFTMPASDVTVTVTFKETFTPAPNNPVPVPESEPDRIVIDMNGEQKAEAEGEENPNTGAPVFAPAVIVLGALALIRRK